MSPPVRTSKDGSNVLQLPVQPKRLDMARAAQHLGITPLRLRMLGWLGGGPATASRGSFHLTELENYERAQYRKAAISIEEMARRRKMRASHTLDGSTPPNIRTGETCDPFMMAMTRLDLQRLAVFFTLKTLAIFAFIMVCLSISPVLYIHSD